MRVAVVGLGAVGTRAARQLASTDDVERVLSYARREAIVQSYAGKAGFARQQLAKGG